MNNGQDVSSGVMGNDSILIHVRKSQRGALNDIPVIFLNTECSKL